MKTHWRATFFLTREKFRSFRPSNIFLAADGLENATSGAEEAFRYFLKENKLVGEEFKMEIHPSSEVEIAEYSAQKLAGISTTAVMS